MFVAARILLQFPWWVALGKWWVVDAAIFNIWEIPQNEECAIRRESYVAARNNKTKSMIKAKVYDTGNYFYQNGLQKLGKQSLVPPKNSQ